jgi:hypothetical protein
MRTSMASLLSDDQAHLWVDSWIKSIVGAYTLSNEVVEKGSYMKFSSDFDCHVTQRFNLRVTRFSSRYDAFFT